MQNFAEKPKTQTINEKKGQKEDLTRSSWTKKYKCIYQQTGGLTNLLNHGLLYLQDGRLISRRLRLGGKTSNKRDAIE